MFLDRDYFKNLAVRLNFMHWNLWLEYMYKDIAVKHVNLISLLKIVYTMCDERSSRTFHQKSLWQKKFRMKHIAKKSFDLKVVWNLSR